VELRQPRFDSRIYCNHFLDSMGKLLMKPFLTAIAISIALITGIVFTDYPEKWFEHNMACSGSIGGGCECTEQSTSFICNKE